MELVGFAVAEKRCYGIFGAPGDPDFLSDRRAPQISPSAIGILRRWSTERLCLTVEAFDSSRRAEYLSGGNASR
ncbi:MAG TPA: hypothetical protein VK602_12210, partial [Phyllobacterium sp.]|nr:hypothetical protein [Phyllobacterium sp.]